MAFQEYLNRSQEFTLKNERKTSFNESVTAIRTSRFNPKLTWGISEIRDDVITTGSGSVTTSGGAGVVSTGTTPNSYSEIRTKERGQYQSGTEGEAGMGIRIASGLISNGTLQTGEEIRWQYCDNTFGFGYGIDETGIFVFRVNNGTFEKIYQTDWNGDKVNGSGDIDTNPSNIKLNLEGGNIFQINFVWYGHGSINFFLNIKKDEDSTDNRVLIHTLQISNDLSVVDPNQPISIVCENGSGGRDLIAYVGGRQFSVVDGNSVPNTRSTVALREDFTVSSSTFVPVLAVRKKATFNGRTNSVNAFFNTINITTSQKIYGYLSIGDTVDGIWVDIPRTPVSETALEQNISATAAGSTQYRQFLAGTLGAQQTTSESTSQTSKTSMGDELVVTLWLRKQSGGTNATVSVYLSFDEEW